MGPHFPLTRSLPFAAFVFLACAALGPDFASAAEQQRKASWLAADLTDTGGAASDQIFDDEVMKWIKDNLNGKCQNLQLVVMGCYSGGFADATLDNAYLGSGNWSVAAAADIDKCETFCISNAEKVKIRVNNTDIERTGAAYGRIFLFGWGAQYMRKVIADADATAKTLATFAKDNMHDPLSGLRFVDNGTGKDAKIHDGVDDNRCIFWQNGLDIAMSGAKNAAFSVFTYRTMVRRGYTDATIDFALDDFKDTDIAPEAPPIKPDRNASKNQLKKMVEDLGTAFASPAEPPRKKAFIWLRAHGNVEPRKAVLRDTPIADGAATIQGPSLSGKTYMAGDDTMSLAMPESLVATFFEGHGADDPLLDPIGAPIVLVTTAEESPGIGSVSVSVNDVPVGFISMAGSSTGGHYVLTIPDPALAQLRSGPNSFAARNHTATIQFGFTSGWFRVATQDDADLGNLPHWGIGITGPALARRLVQFVSGGPTFAPGLSPWAILALITLLLMSGTWRIRIAVRDGSAERGQSSRAASSHS